MDSMKKIDESGTDRRMKFVAINLTNLPSIRDQSVVDNTNVRHRVTILEIQMSELMASKFSVASEEPTRLALVTVVVVVYPLP